MLQPALRTTARVLLLLAAAALAVAACGGTTPVDAPPPAVSTSGPQATLALPPTLPPLAGTPAVAAGEWLVMVYANADDPLIGDQVFAQVNEMELVGAGDSVHLVVQLDRHPASTTGQRRWSGTRRYYLQADPDLDDINTAVVQDLGEVNMASPETLADFVAWAITTYPAEKRALVLVGSGMGWAGLLNDDSSAPRDEFAVAGALGEQMWLYELDQALDAGLDSGNVSALDVLVFDAGQMGTAETMATAARYARVAVARQSRADGLGLAWSSALAALRSAPAQTGEALAAALVAGAVVDDVRLTDDVQRAALAAERQGLVDARNPVVPAGIDPGEDPLAAELGFDAAWAAYDLTAFAQVTTRLAALTDLISLADYDAVHLARARARAYDSPFDGDQPSPVIDLGLFAGLLATYSPSAEVAEAAEALVAAIDDSVLEHQVGPGMVGASGYSIHFPADVLYRRAENHDYDELAGRFAVTSGWPDFLAAHHGVNERAGLQRLPGPRTSGSEVPTSVSYKPLGLNGITLSPELLLPGETLFLASEVSAGLGVLSATRFVGRMGDDSALILIEELAGQVPDSVLNVGDYVVPDWDRDIVDLSDTWDQTRTVIVSGPSTHFVTLSARDQTNDDTTLRLMGQLRAQASSGVQPIELLFRGGRLVGAFVYAGDDTLRGPGLPYTPRPGDLVSVLQPALDLTASPPAQLMVAGDEFRFGDQALVLGESDVPGDKYAVGLLVRDLDGQVFLDYDTVFVQNDQNPAQAGFRSYENGSLGMALLRPDTWSAFAIDENSVGFTSDTGLTTLAVRRSSHPDAATSAAANQAALTEALFTEQAFLSRIGAPQDVAFEGQAETVVVGSSTGQHLAFTANYVGEPGAGRVTMVTPRPGVTYTLVMYGALAEADAAADVYDVVLGSFDSFVAPGAIRPSASVPEYDPAGEGFFVEAFTGAGLPAVADAAWGSSEYDTAAQVYRVFVLAGAGPAVQVYPDVALTERFVITAGLNYGGSPDNAIGVVFNAQDDTRFYAFRLTGDGFYTVERADGQTLTPLIDWTRNEAVEFSVGQPVELAVVGQSGAVQLYVNGERIDSFSDPFYRGGGAGIIVDNYDTLQPLTANLVRFEAGPLPAFDGSEAEPEDN